MAGRLQDLVSEDNETSWRDGSTVNRQRLFFQRTLVRVHATTWQLTAIGDTMPSSGLYGHTQSTRI